MDEDIWLEKYRPRTLDQIVGNDPLVSRLKVLRQERNVPNMILTGPPGCGKTTSVLALAQEVLGSNFKNATMELNASDDRGIDVVRDKVKQFAEKKVRLEPGQHKVIILDEADSLTEAAQQALRMIISDYSDSTRFVFSCNDSSKLIEPIQSRCAILKYRPLEKQDVVKYLQHVAEKEGVKYDRDGLEFLAFVADGDMRNAVNNLQAVAVTKGDVTQANVELICDVPKLQVVEELFKAISAGDLEASLELFQEIWQHEYSPHDLINFFGRVLDSLEIKEQELKFNFIQHMGRLKISEAMGLGTKIHILGMVAELVEIAQNFRDKRKY